MGASLTTFIMQIIFENQDREPHQAYTLTCSRRVGEALILMITLRTNYYSAGGQNGNGHSAQGSTNLVVYVSTRRIWLLHASIFS